MTEFYRSLAVWWPLVSPVDDYADEAAGFVRVIEATLPEAVTVLELGSGGGHNAFHLKARFTLTLTDVSSEMLAVSRVLNPDCEHHAGDMRTLDLGRTFDVVFIHDAIAYMLTEDDLAAAVATAHRHCRTGGIALFVPDEVRESFVPGTDCGGTDGPGGEGVRYLEWSYDLDPADTVTTTEYSFLLREADGTVRAHHETHHTGLFDQATWRRVIAEQGFTAEAVQEQTDEDRPPRVMFLGHRS